MPAPFLQTSRIDASILRRVNRLDQEAASLEFLHHSCKLRLWWSSSCCSCTSWRVPVAGEPVMGGVTKEAAEDEQGVLLHITNLSDLSTKAQRPAWHAAFLLMKPQSCRCRFYLEVSMETCWPLLTSGQVKTHCQHLNLWMWDLSPCEVSDGWNWG